MEVNGALDAAEVIMQSIDILRMKLVEVQNSIRSEIYDPMEI